MNEKVAELDGAYSDAASLVATWRSLLDHPGWKMYEKFLLEQRQNRIATVALIPLESSAKIFAQEFMKGEAAGLGLAQITPYAQLEQAEADVKVLSVKLDREKEHVEEDAKARGASRVDDRDFSRDR